ncbi:hypothetical protein ABK905_00460 [Acerihabitans sp. KWT182]|uniref:DMT family transporter n=1 Tax=Acerihabitans sp. KWT182 TaxID=3157919 RepID=A0AAU7QAJ7_9GAMM
MLLVNFTTLVSFLGYFIALKYIEPAIYSVVATSVGPVITLFITGVILKYERAKGVDILSCSGIIVSMFFLVYAIYSGRSAVGSISLSSFVNGLFMTFISGCAMTINNIWSGRLNKRGVRPEYILASRFILLIVFSLFAAGPEPVVTTAKEYGFSIALIALLGNTFSLFLLQYGIKHTSSFSVAMILVCSPLFCLIFQGMDHQFAFSLYSTIGILSCSLFVLIGIWGKKQKTMPKESLTETQTR